ncbi:MAG: phosphatase PAP2 family protein [Prochlorococcaceae cyanobacterium]
MAFIALVAVLVVALDRPLLQLLIWPGKPPKSDLLLLLRVWGSLWLWLGIALNAGILEWRRVRRGLASTVDRVGVLLLSPLLGGLLAEGLKLLVRRERPSGLDAYLFRSWLERPWSTSGLGLPSSHAAVAFGGSAALGLVYPELRWPAALMALGCGFTRVASGAHYPTDVLVAAVVGVAAAQLVSQRLVPQLTRRLGSWLNSLPATEL